MYPSTGYIGDFEGTSDYEYDRIGNLVSDNGAHIKEITWTFDGKVQAVRFDNNATDEYGNYYSDLEFQYDAMGNRVRKIEFPRTQAGDPAGYDCAKYTYYLRDAQGNIMSIMQMRPDANCEFSLYLEDLYIYGSDRLGQVKISSNWYSLTDYSN